MVGKNSKIQQMLIEKKMLFFDGFSFLKFENCCKLISKFSVKIRKSIDHMQESVDSQFAIETSLLGLSFTSLPGGNHVDGLPPAPIFLI